MASDFVPFNYVFDKFTIATIGEYPGPNALLPNMIVTPNIKPEYYIDPETSKDLDDAICVKKENNDYRLWVSIADVSHYVTPDS